MKLWDDLSKAGKTAGALTAIIVLSTALFGLVSAVQTDAEADTWRVSHKLDEYESRQADKYQRADRELKRLQLQRYGQQGLSDNMKEILDVQIKEYEELKKCIKRNEC